MPTACKLGRDKNVAPTNPGFGVTPQAADKLTRLPRAGMILWWVAGETALPRSHRSEAEHSSGIHTGARNLRLW